MIEVERKYRLDTEKAKDISKWLREITPTSTTVHQIDTVYLKGIKSFKQFLPGMGVMRIRTEGGASKLTYKKAINQSGDSIEHELTISSAEIMQNILQEDDYRVVTQVTKDRLEVQTKEVTYALDYVENLGWFLEIEIIIADTTTLNHAEKIIKLAAAKLSLSDDMIEQKKYDQLLTTK